MTVGDHAIAPTCPDVAPSANTGGGLDSTVRVTLPGAGLAPGAPLNVAIDLAI